MDECCSATAPTAFITAIRTTSRRQALPMSRAKLSWFRLFVESTCVRCTRASTALHGAASDTVTCRLRRALENRAVRIQTSQQPRRRWKWPRTTSRYIGKSYGCSREETRVVKPGGEGPPSRQSVDLAERSSSATVQERSRGCECCFHTVEFCPAGREGTYRNALRTMHSCCNQQSHQPGPRQNRHRQREETTRTRSPFVKRALIGRVGGDGFHR